MNESSNSYSLFAIKPAILLTLAALALCGWFNGTPAGSCSPSNISPPSQFAATPPMGWNSWDSFGLRINEEQFLGNVEVLATKLKPFGYDTAVIDEGWFMVNPEDRPHPELLHYQIDSNGRYIPVPARFPSALKDGANSGFQEIARRIHARGLKFGIHIVRGIPRESVMRNLPIEGSSYKLALRSETHGRECHWPQVKSSRHR